MLDGVDDVDVALQLSGHLTPKGRHGDPVWLPWLKAFSWMLPLGGLLETEDGVVDSTM